MLENFPETKIFGKGLLVCFEICCKQDPQGTFKSELVEDCLTYA